MKELFSLLGKEGVDVLEEGQLLSFLIRNSHKDGLNHFHWDDQFSVFIYGANIGAFQMPPVSPDPGAPPYP